MRLAATHNDAVRAARGPSVIEDEDDRFGSVEAFLEFLARLSADEWLVIGAQGPLDAQTVAILDATVADQQLELDAWLVRDAVETLVSLASRSLPLGSRKQYRAMGCARVAAERAATAILTRSWLPTSDIAALLSPFSVRLQKALVRAP